MKGTGLRSPLSSRAPSPTRAGNGFWTSQRDGEVQLRLEKDSFADEAPLTVHDMVLATTTKFAHCIALGSKQENGWHMLTYIEYYEECRRAAKAFLKLGLERFHGVGIMGSNSEEWVIASLGAILAGGLSVGILSTNSPKVCQVIAESSEIDVFVVDSDRQLQKIIQIQGSLKHLKGIIQYKEEIRMKEPNLYSWEAFLDLAKDVSDEKLDQVIDSQKPNQCCTLVYSLSGAGPPKAVMLSHDNITWTTAATVQSLSYSCPPEKQEVLLSYLPLSSIGVQLFDMWTAICVAGALYFAPPDALRGSLLDTLREVQPTSFHGVPWVWDHMRDCVKTAQLAATPFRRRVHQWAMRMGLRTNRKRMLGWLTFNPARTLLGLNRCLQFFNTGQGLPRDTLEYFLGLDVPIFELYGLTECTGVHTFSGHQNFRLLSCGKELPGTYTKVQQEDAAGVGAIHIWGRHIFMGYLNDKERTREMISQYSWLHTGDLGLLDANNFLYIMGSVKDIITLKSGEKINPTPIEERVKRHVPLARYVTLVGQDAPYLCALLTLKCQVHPETGEPRNALTSEAVTLCRQLKSQSTRLTDIIGDKDPLVAEFIRQGIKAANAEVFSDCAKIVKWTVLETDFSVAGGELGATTKVKRAVVAKMYQAEIGRFYEDREDY
ncbi:long-chain-fatty-acid--CoA ligase ACSBG2-like isoform X2 [Tamandua tetradactyla]|uniref:long-chain-fatty-acid--CoA ligase ACSBG2-like isoform X2 n=1 Tax=Tamandua tetradactyla TaxID=48850 RepID=UPI004053B60E